MLKYKTIEQSLIVGVGLLVCLAACCLVKAAETRGGKESADYLSASGEDMARWRELKFGLFVHWGPVILMREEISWSRGGKRGGRKGTGDIPVEVYDNLYRSFYPAQFDAKEWVEIAKAAGMKYLVFTTKHHDGFSMFDSALTDYKITNSPFKRDIVKELADACHEGGLKLGFYYSPRDWYHPDFGGKNHAGYIEFYLGQLRELCSNYGKVDILWFDGLGGSEKLWGDTPEKSFQVIRSLQPHIILNNRGGLRGDFDTPEQRIGVFEAERPWETCMTICRQWAWKPKDEMKSLKQCIQALVRTVAGDGNFLFNVGPMPTGEIEPRQVARLKEMGDWLSKYGQSIHGTRGGPFKGSSLCASTYKDNRIYVHIFNWHGEKFVLPVIGRKIVGSSVLTGGEVDVRQSEGGVSVCVAKEYHRELDTIVVFELDGPAKSIEPIDVASNSLAYRKKAAASSVYQDRASSRPDKAFDDNYESCWRARTNEGWLEVDLGEARAVDSAVIFEGSEYFGAEKFELQCRIADEWRTLSSGTKLGQPAVLKFEAVRAQRFRLNVSRENRQLIVCEFQLFGPHR